MENIIQHKHKDSDALRNEEIRSEVRNVFSVDLEEWFHGLTSTNRQVARWPLLESRVEDATRTLLALLRAARVQATFFVLGHVADHHPGLIAEICADGHEVGIHGYYHRFVSRLTPQDFAQEVEKSLAAVERIAGVAAQGHRAPYFSINAQTPWAFDVLARYGLRYDSSVFPTRNMLYGFPGAPRFPYQPAGSTLVEVPASTVRVAGVNLPVAGGFYMRSMPYAVTRWAVRRLNRAGKPAIVYVHPWELDLGQNYPHVTARERLTHYHGRRSLAGKLTRLLGDFRFGTAAALVDRLELAPMDVAVVEPAAG
jgi:polysaccharide deacetylase family protein (PEP-CTERM system associated)